MMVGSRDLSDAKRRLLEMYLRGEGAPVTIPERRSTVGARPLSPGERQIWRHAQLADLAIYNEPVTVHRTGPLDRDALRRSLSEIVRRHEAWRTGFPEVDGEPRPQVRAPFAPDFAFDDLTGLPAAERDVRARTLAAEDAQSPFDLSRPPLFRARLVRMNENAHRLYLTLHHIIFDGVALYHVFLPELAALHDAFAAGLPSPLSEPAPGYTSFAAWSAEREPSSEDVSYWRTSLAPLPAPLDLPADRVRPPRRTFRGAILPLAIDATVARGIHGLAESRTTTPYVVLLSAFEALLHRYTGRDDFLVGSVTAGRDRSEFERVMGFFLNTVPLRATLSNDPTFAALIDRNREVTLGALAHAGVPFERLVREFETDPSPDRNPLFSVLFSLEPPMPPLPEGWGLTQIDVQTGTSKFDLSLELDERPPEIVGRFIYNTDLFDRETIVRFERHWRALVASAVAAPERRLSELDLSLPGEEPTAAIGPARDVTVGPVPESFASQARRTPNLVALRVGDAEISYGDLDGRVGAMAEGLRDRGIGRESRVGVCLPRSADRIAVLLAIGRAGGAYVALDPVWPPARIAAVASDAGPDLIVADRFPGSSALRGRVVAPEDLAPGLAKGRLRMPDASPSDLAYVLYTSGSTGVPKGVMIEHRSISNLLSWSQRLYPLGPGCRVLHKAPLGFDASVWEIFAPLVAGATLVLAPEGAESDPEAFARFIAENRITHLKLVPSLLAMLLQTAAFRRCTALAHVFCGGEVLTPELSAAFFRQQSAQLHNLYGPTETCVDVAAHRCRPGETGRVPIGAPIDNTRLLVLDPKGRPVPAGVPGELMVSGLPLARGYLGREDWTRERFVRNPADPSERIYRTGDRVRQREDGELEFLGRLDDQVKVRGVRVEPREVEEALRAHPSVRRALVLARDGADHPSLVGYVEVGGGSRPSPRELRDHVAARLPRALVPDAVVVLDELPRTASGKVDRSALPPPDRAVPTAPRRPATAEERLLAGIWSDVLGVGPVGVDDNLFELGGNSLVVFQITARAAQAGYAITPRQLFEHPTVAEIVRAAGTLARPSTGAAPSRPAVTHG